LIQAVFELANEPIRGDCRQILLGIVGSPPLFTFLYRKEAEKFTENRSQMKIVTATVLRQIGAPCCNETSWLEHHLSGWLCKERQQQQSRIIEK